MLRGYQNREHSFALVKSLLFPHVLFSPFGFAFAAFQVGMVIYIASLSTCLV